MVVFNLLKGCESMNKFFLTSSAQEFSVAGLSFYCIYGTYINGAYVAILNWGVSADLSAYGNNVGYNTSKIYSALLRSDQKGWLPGAKKAREAIARELAEKVGAAIEQIGAKRE